MNKVIILLTGSFLFCFAGAQAQIYFGPKIGTNLSTWAYDWKDSKDEPKSSIVLRPVIGGMLNYKISKKVFLQPEINYSLKGTSVDAASVISKNRNPSGKIITRIHYIELPVNVGYEFKMGYKGGYLCLFGGPYAAVAHYAQDRYNYTAKLPGKPSEPVVKYDNADYYVFTGNFDEAKYKKNPENPAMKRFDYGINVGAGYIYKNFYLNVAYQYGLANLAPNIKYSNFDIKSSDIKTYNRTLQISLAYLIDPEMGGK